MFATKFTRQSRWSILEQSKVRSYVGFCIRARKISFGITAIGMLKSGVFLLILDGDAAKNSIRYALKFKKRFACPLLICKYGFSDLVNKPECKIAAIKDKSLAEAILNSGEDGYEIYTGGGE